MISSMRDESRTLIWEGVVCFNGVKGDGVDACDTRVRMVTDQRYRERIAVHGM